MELYNILLIILAAIVAAAPISFIKKYTQTKEFYWIILSIISFLILIYIYTIILYNKNIYIIYAIVKIISIIFVIICGLIIFNYKLNIKKIFGILLGLISIYILSSDLS